MTAEPAPLSYAEFQRLDIRVGRVVSVDDFPEARKPAYKLRIDFGAGIGVKKSSAQATKHYSKEELLNRLVDQTRKPAALEVLQAGVGKEVRLVRIEDVVYFESDTRYTRVVYSNSEGDGEVLIRTPLKELLAQLDPNRFWQVHRAVIVNHRHIASAVRIDEGNMLLSLRGRTEKLPVSRQFQGLFKGQ